MTSNTKNVFISYSHDDEDHKSWVLKLATDLRKNGIDAILDQWDAALGQSLTKFMEQGLTDTDRVLVVCTDKYNEKANNRVGGAGYEGAILTGELIISQDTKKFIPVIRAVSNDRKVPTCLSGRRYIDFTNDKNYQNLLRELIHEIYDVPVLEKPELGKNPFAKPINDLPFLNKDSTVFFNDRFSKAFPGVRGITWFRDPKIAIQRLCLLLESPMVFKDSDPVCWWRNGDLHIRKFKKIDDSSVLMDEQELLIDEIAAVNAGAYYQSFVYVKTRASEKSGLYDYPIDAEVADYGFAREEFAEFEGHLITRAEYDDGAAVIDGVPVSTVGKASLRIRYVTPYNFIIAPINSPINNNKFDRIRDEILTDILRGKATLEDFLEDFMKLPKKQTF